MTNRHSGSMMLVVLAIAGILQAAPQSQSRKQEPNQSPPPPPVQQTQGAVSTGGAHAAVLDREKRPITAGGFVENGPIVFQDVTEKGGLAHWRHVMGTEEPRFILDTVGSGVALIDYDNDGWLDIYLVNGSTYEAMAGKAPAPPPTARRSNRMRMRRCTTGSLI